MTSQNGDNPAVYEFDGFRLDAAKRLVFSADGTTLPLKTKAFDTLLFLVENPERVVGRDELMDAVWPDTIVEENNLTQHISSLRRLFDEKPDAHRFIATVPGHGYRFVAKVRVPADPLEAASIPPVVTPTVSRKWFVLLAVAVSGSLLVLGFFYRNQPTLPTSEPVKSVAILPFRPLVAGEGNEEMELGLADALISSLGRNRSIKVLPLSAVRRFNKPDQNPVAVGQELGVDSVLQASLQRSGGSVRVIASLINVSNGSIIWSGTFDREFNDILDLQTRIATQIAGALNFQLTGDEISRLEKRYTNSAEANECYFKGRYNTLKATEEGIRQGIGFYERAVQIDPAYALAYAGMADAYRVLALLGFTRPTEIWPRAKDLANKALELDPNLAEPYIVLGYVNFLYEWDMRSAETNLKHALDLDPDNADAHRGYAHFLSNAGRHDEAITEIRLAKEINPMPLIVQVLECQFLLYAGREEEAVDQIKKASDFESDVWTVRYNLGRAYLFQKRYSEAIAELTRALQINPRAHFARMYLGVAYAESGDRKKAIAMIEKMRELSKKEFISSYSLAMIHNALRQKEEALTRLRQALTDREAYLTYLLLDKHWNNLRTETRFVEITKQVNSENQMTF